jgi:hypothetical protein
MAKTLPSLEVVPWGFLMWPLIDSVLLDCGFPEEPRPAYKRGWGSVLFELHFPRSVKTLAASFHRPVARLPAALLLAGGLARVKQTARRRRRYVAMSTSSSSAAASPPADASPTADASSEETLSSLMVEELRAGDSVDFGVSRMSSVRVQDMQRLGYFGGGVARVPGTEEVPEPEGELVVFEAFFAAGLRLPAHRFVGEVRGLGAGTGDFEVPDREPGLRCLEWVQEELQALPTVVEGFMAYASLVTCEGAMNALSREGCRHFEVFDQADEDFERDIFKVEDPVVKESAGAIYDRMWGPHGREVVRERAETARAQVIFSFGVCWM